MCSLFRDPENRLQDSTPFYLKPGGKTVENEIADLSLTIGNIIGQASAEGREVVFLCIGSDRYVGDSLGPLVGSMLEDSGVPYKVYGTLKDPVHAFNLKGTIKEINRQFTKPVIFSVDASLGTKEEAGSVIFREGPVKPGKGIEKVLPSVGDYHFAGVVNYIDPLPTSQFLNDTRLYTVMTLAQAIVKVITATLPDENQ
ncbi:MULTISPECIES: spore protease YyaC [Bhargavaea]|uniref:Spore protease YyaC n=1 Tax=Bhargavaea changchunensis TaxID=2134037 RepID=A0ABW2NDT9_9BACL|nr:spore protease YyaC [Bhargavaea sp. CC-171006]